MLKTSPQSPCNWDLISLTDHRWSYCTDTYVQGGHSFTARTFTYCMCRFAPHSRALCLHCSAAGRMRAGVKERSLCPSLRTRVHVLVGTKIDLHRRPYFYFSLCCHSFFWSCARSRHQMSFRLLLKGSEIKCAARTDSIPPLSEGVWRKATFNGNLKTLQNKYTNMHFLLSVIYV